MQLKQLYPVSLKCTDHLINEKHFVKIFNNDLELLHKITRKKCSFIKTLG